MNIEGIRLQMYGSLYRKVVLLVSRVLMINIVGGKVDHISMYRECNGDGRALVNTYVAWRISPETIAANRDCIPTNLDPFDDDGNIHTSSKDLAWRRVIVSFASEMADVILNDMAGIPDDEDMLGEWRDIKDRDEVINSVLPQLEPGLPSYHWIKSAEREAEVTLCHFWPLVSSLSELFIESNPSLFEGDDEAVEVLDPDEVRKAIIDYWHLPQRDQIAARQAVQQARFRHILR